MVWREGGRGSRAHSPELVVARLLVIAHVLVVSPVLTVARVLVVARVRSWALAVIREPGSPFWLVVGASWFVGDGEARSSVGGRCCLWAGDGGG